MFWKWQRWFKTKENAVQYKVRSIWVIDGEERFRFEIFYCLKSWHNFEMDICLLRGRVGVILADKSF